MMYEAKVERHTCQLGSFSGIDRGKMEQTITDRLREGWMLISTSAVGNVVFMFFQREVK